VKLRRTTDFACRPLGAHAWALRPVTTCRNAAECLPEFGANVPRHRARVVEVALRDCTRSPRLHCLARAGTRAGLVAQNADAHPHRPRAAMERTIAILRSRRDPPMEDLRRMGAHVFVLLVSESSPVIGGTLAARRAGMIDAANDATARIPVAAPRVVLASTPLATHASPPARPAASPWPRRSAEEIEHDVERGPGSAERDCRATRLPGS
jgi:hypothetical protein